MTISLLLFTVHFDLIKKRRMKSEAAAVFPGCLKSLHQVWQQLSQLDISLGSCQRPTLGNDNFNEEKYNLPLELLALQMQLTSDRLGGPHCREWGDPSLSAHRLYIWQLSLQLAGNICTLSRSYFLVSVLI